MENSDDIRFEYPVGITSLGTRFSYASISIDFNFLWDSPGIFTFDWVAHKNNLTMLYISKSHKPKIGISQCLLGEKVRYNGRHKLNTYLKDTLGSFVDFVHICPEIECGLSIPRESLHLFEPIDSPRLIGIESGNDYTDQMHKWIEKRIPELEKENLCGFIFKTKSPSCAMRDIKINKVSGDETIGKTAGIFANTFMKHFPDIPVEDEEQLNDPVIRENFIERLFTCTQQQNQEYKNRRSHIS